MGGRVSLIAGGQAVGESANARGDKGQHVALARRWVVGGSLVGHPKGGLKGSRQVAAILGIPATREHGQANQETGWVGRGRRLCCGCLTKRATAIQTDTPLFNPPFEDGRTHLQSTKRWAAATNPRAMATRPHVPMLYVVKVQMKRRTLPNDGSASTSAK